MEYPQGNYPQPPCQGPGGDAAEQPRVAHSGIHAGDVRITLPLVELLALVDQERWPGFNDRDEWTDEASADFGFNSNVDKLLRAIAFRSGERYRAFFEKTPAFAARVRMGESTAWRALATLKAAGVIRQVTVRLGDKTLKGWRPLVTIPPAVLKARAALETPKSEVSRGPELPNRERKSPESRVSGRPKPPNREGTTPKSRVLYKERTERNGQEKNEKQPFSTYSSSSVERSTNNLPIPTEGQIVELLNRMKQADRFRWKSTNQAVRHYQSRPADFYRDLEDQEAHEAKARKGQPRRYSAEEGARTLETARLSNERGRLLREISER